MSLEMAYFFPKPNLFFKISSDRNEWGRISHGWSLAALVDEPIIKSLNKVGYAVDDLLSKIHIIFNDDTDPVIYAFNIFSPADMSSLIDSEEQLKILCEHYGVQKIDVMNGQKTCEQKFETTEFLPNLRINMPNYLME